MAVIVTMWEVFVEVHMWVLPVCITGGGAGMSDGRKGMLKGLKTFIKDQEHRQRSLAKQASDQDKLIKSLERELEEKERIIQHFETGVETLYRQYELWESQASVILSRRRQPDDHQPEQPVAPQVQEEDPVMDRIAKRLEGSDKNKLNILESFAMDQFTQEAAFNYAQKYFKQFADNLEELISSDGSWCLFTTFTETPKIFLYLNLFLASEVLSLHMIKSLLQCLEHEDKKVQDFGLKIIKKFKPSAEEIHSARSLSFDDIPERIIQQALVVVRRR
jgi:hypothetical protein